jgi:pimeloyl-ACP methyl ester carboxylesterase
MNHTTTTISVSSEIQLNTETFGTQTNPAILLISGAMAPARFWTDKFCQQLADSGYFVIRYDHRDMGLSSAIDFEQHPYSLNDLARDAIAILDGYKIQKAHLIGHSMDGSIAQIIALDYPSRVLSITLISSSVLATPTLTPDERDQLAATWHVFQESKPTKDFAQSIDGFMKSYKFLHGTIEMDKAIATNYIRDMYERTRPEHLAWFEAFSSDTQPIHNHVRAQQGTVDRTQELGHIKFPVLVIHGQDDCLQFARVVKDYCIKNIPHATMYEIPKMGHMILNNELFKKIADLWKKNIL